MKFLVVHQNFPGQFRHLVQALYKRGHEVIGTKMAQGPVVSSWNGVNVYNYFPRRSSTPQIHPWLVDFETKIVRAEAWLLLARMLKKQGYEPDVVLAHPGWGETFFVRHVWPETRLYTYNEYYYRARSGDLNFDPEFSVPDEDDGCRMALKNINHDYHLGMADKQVSPTHWQKNSYPGEVREKIAVIHDGIDTILLKPDSNATLKIADGVYLDRSTPVVTFVSRVLEPYRGYHTFARAMPALLRAHKDVRIAIVGGDGNGYGNAQSAGIAWAKTFWQTCAKELRPDETNRVHFLGQIPYDAFTALLRLSRAHVYLTYPFVLSWSLLEAMSLGCPIIGSRTPPVEEVIRDQENGLLVDFFSPDLLAQAILRILSDRDLSEHLGAQARHTVQSQYDLQSVALPKWLEFIEH